MKFNCINVQKVSFLQENIGSRDIDTALYPDWTTYVYFWVYMWAACPHFWKINGLWICKGC